MVPGVDQKLGNMTWCFLSRKKLKETLVCVSLEAAAHGCAAGHLAKGKGVPKSNLCVTHKATHSSVGLNHLERAPSSNSHQGMIGTSSHQEP